MAALLKKFYNGLSYSTISHILRTRLLQGTPQIVSSRQYASNEPDPPDDFAIDMEEEQPKLRFTEEEIENLRNVSRLSPHLRDILHRKLPDMTNPCFQDLRFQRKMYAKFGEASGINPKLLWPTRSELKELMEEEEILQKPLDELLSSFKQEQKEYEMKLKKKEEDVDKNMSQMVKMISEYRAKIREKRANKRRAQASKENLVAIVRDHYGYEISNKDPKFKAIAKQKKEEIKMRQKEAKAAKKQMKAAKKEERREFLLQMGSASVKKAESSSKLEQATADQGKSEEQA